MQRLNPGIDYANLVFTMPARFAQIYQNMSHDQCEAFINVRDKQQKSVLEHLEMLPEKVAVLTFILERLTAKKIVEICSVTDENKQTVLHRLAAQAGNEALIDIIFNKVPEPHLAGLLLLQDKFDKTIFHHQKSLCSIEVFKNILTNESIIQTINAISYIQDNSGGTILHHFANFSKNHYADLMQKITAGNFDKVVAQEDKSGHNILYYTACKQSTDVLYAIHEKAVASHKENKNSANYPVAIASALRKLYYENHLVTKHTDDYEHVVAKIKLWLKMAKEILEEVELPAAYLTSHSSENSHMPLFFFLQKLLYMPFQYSCYQGLRHLEVIPLAVKQDVKSITIALHNKVPQREYFQMLEEYQKIFISFLHTLDRRDVIYNSSTLLKSIDYLPQCNTDPLKVFRFYDMDSSKYADYLFKPEISVVNHPKEFAEFYKEIVNYQVVQFSKYNREYLAIIDRALLKINEIIFHNPANANKYSHCQNQLITMRNFLLNATEKINIADLLTIKTDDEMTLEQFIQLADYSTLAASYPNIVRLTKLRLEFNALHFLYTAAQRQLLKPKPVADEKEEIVMSLDEEDLADNHHDVDTRKSILLLNARVIQGLDLHEDEDVSENKIEEAKYQQLVQKFKSDFKIQHAIDINTHIGEFSNYIVTRSKAKSFLVINTEDDYKIREAYFDALVSFHHNSSRKNIVTAVNLINHALKDKRLSSGLSHRCLDILKKLKVDFDHRLYLFDLDPELVEQSNHEVYFETKNAENIAFMLPWEFVPYQLVNSDEYHLLLNSKDSNNVSILNYYKHDEASLEMFMELFSNLSQEHIDQICLIRDKTNKTLLHRLRQEKGNQKLIDFLFNRISSRVLAEIVLIQDDDRNTILNYQKSDCSIATFKQLIEIEVLFSSLCKAALFQNRLGKTIFHSSPDNITYYYHLFSLLNAAITDKLLLVTDNDNNNILYYIYAGHTFLTEELHQKFLAYHIQTKSDNYPKAIVHLIKHADRDPKFRFQNELLWDSQIPKDLPVLTQEAVDSNLKLLIKASAEIIKAGINPRFLSESICFYPHTPALFELLRLVYILSYTGDLIYFNRINEHSFYLLQVVGADSFFEDFEKFYGIGLVDALSSESSRVFRGVQYALRTNYCYPFVDVQPLKLRDYFSTMCNEDLHILPYYHYIFYPERVEPADMKPFIKFYSKVVENQLHEIVKPDARILPILRTSVEIIKKSGIHTAELHHQKKQLELLITLMTIALQPHTDADKVLEIPINPEDSLRQQNFLSDLCYSTADTLADEDSRKLKLILNGLRFHHLAADKSVAEEKKDNIDESNINFKPASRLNAIVYKVLGYETDTYPETVDEKAYETVVNHYAVSLKTLNKKNLLTHLEEFKDYIDKRGLTPPTLFRHSAEDYKVRKAYFDLIVSSDNSLEAVNKKLEVIDAAFKDPKLKGIITHRCLDFLNLLKRDFSDILYLAGFSETYQQDFDRSASSLNRP